MAFAEPWQFPGFKVVDEALIDLSWSRVIYSALSTLCLLVELVGGCEAYGRPVEVRRYYAL
jgi:hypothetical protein